MEESYFQMVLEGLGAALKSNAVNFVLIPLMVPLLTFVHEAGHAVAAVALGHRVSELTVGDKPLLTVRTGSFRMRLGGLSGKSDLAGFVRLTEGTRAVPRDWIIIGLAGPLASLCLAIASAATYFSVSSPPFGLLFLAGVGLLDFAANLIPRADGHGGGSDGYLVQVGWRDLRNPPPPPAWVDPSEATSVPPPGG